MGKSANFNKNILFLKSKYDEEIDYGLIKKKSNIYRCINEMHNLKNASNAMGITDE